MINKSMSCSGGVKQNKQKNGFVQMSVHIGSSFYISRNDSQVNYLKNLNIIFNRLF